ncbi:hypothetical protein HI914_05494 [Erysiphe necator]|nr:hypothetical protein HI914_05494 [Erysiphe necator]
MPPFPSRSRSVRRPISHVALAPNDSSAASSSASTAIKSNTGASESEKKHDLSPSRLPIKPTQSSSRTKSSKDDSLQPHLPPEPGSNPITTSNAPSLDIQRSASNRQSKKLTSSEIEPIRKDRSRPPVATVSRHLRHNSSNSSTGRVRDPSKGRERSSSTLPSSSYSRPPTRNSVSSNVSERVSTYVSERKPLKKPAFSTHQQHYTPAKNIAPKLHPAVFLAPPTPSKWPSNKVISAETSKLQNELLQLHLLHRDYGLTERQWRASAKSKLETRFQNMVEMEHSILELEKFEDFRLNSIALEEWPDVGTSGWGLDEKKHIFENILIGLMSTRDPGGRYARVTQNFEYWVDTYEQTMERREKEDEDYSDLLLVKELDSTWREDCFYLERKLELWKDNIRDLGIPQSESSLELVVDQVQRIILGMLVELDSMMRLEREVKRREEHWIKAKNDEMLENVTKDNALVAGAIWRSIGVYEK